MPSATLTANGTTTSGTVTGGGGNPLTATTDASDSSYVQMTGLGQSVDIDFTTVTMTAGAVGKTMTPRQRLSGTGGKGIVCTYQNGYAGATLASGGIAVGGTGPFDCTGSTVAFPFTQAQLDAIHLQEYVMPAYGGTWLLVETQGLDIVYANPPTTAITAPTASQVITTTTYPTISWTHTPGTDGDVQTVWQVIVANRTVASAGGYDPLTGATLWNSGAVSSAATSVVCGASLPNGGAYRAFVRSAQTINGVVQWPTSFATVDFTISVTPPATPTLTATLMAATGRVQLVMATSTAVSALAYFEVQASTDGGTTWGRNVRGDVAGFSGRIVASSNSLTRHDYEMEVGDATVYRCRVVGLISGAYIASSYSSTTGSITWLPTGLWLKSPLAPALNLSGLRLQRAPDFKRGGRATVLYGVGQRNPVVISDARAGYQGSIAVLTTSAADRTALAALLDRQEPLLIQGPNVWELDVYAQPLDVGSGRPTRLVVQPDRYEDLPLVQTDRPSDKLPVESWPP